MAALIWGGLMSVLGSLVGQILVALGIGYVSYSGMDVILSYGKSLIIDNLGATSASIVGVLGLLKVGTAVNIMFSAVAAKMTIAGVKSGAVKHMRIK